MPSAMAHGRGLHAALVDYLREEQDRGRVRADADLDAVGTIVVGACHELVLPRLHRDPAAVREVPPGRIAAVVATVLHGIAAPTRE